MQIRELTEYCDRRGWKPIVFTDRTSSAKFRPELEQLKKACQRRKFDVVVVYRFDRFARSSIELLTALEEFRTLGIDFVSLHENVDTTTPQGKLMFAIIAAFAEFEREIIRERVRSGLAQARANGKQLGRRPRNPDVEQIAALRSQGATWPAIAAQMGISRNTAIRALLASQKPVTKTVQ
jgi:DNA invertase Pin-like site-specific DNA recombinase